MFLKTNAPATDMKEGCHMDVEDDQDLESDSADFTKEEQKEINKYIKEYDKKNMLNKITAQFIENQITQKKRIQQLKYDIEYGSHTVTTRYSLN